MDNKSKNRAQIARTILSALVSEDLTIDNSTKTNLKKAIDLALPGTTQKDFDDTLLYLSRVEKHIRFQSDYSDPTVYITDEGKKAQQIEALSTEANPSRFQ